MSLCIKFKLLQLCITVRVFENKKAFLKEKGLKCSLYGLVEQDSYYLFFLAAFIIIILLL